MCFEHHSQIRLVQDERPDAPTSPPFFQSEQVLGKERLAKAKRLDSPNSGWLKIAALVTERAGAGQVVGEGKSLVQAERPETPNTL